MAPPVPEPEPSIAAEFFLKVQSVSTGNAPSTKEHAPPLPPLFETKSIFCSVKLMAPELAMAPPPDRGAAPLIRIILDMLISMPAWNPVLSK